MPLPDEPSSAAVAELGLTGSDAIARAAQPPSDINRQRERASGQPDLEAVDWTPHA